VTWVKLDDQFFAHERIVGLSKDAKLLYLAGLTYCSSQLTDGRMGRGALRLVGALADVAPETPMAELLEAGLWMSSETGYIVHDYLDYNPTAEQVKQQRTANAQRQAEWRERRVARNGVTNAVSNAPNNGRVTAPRPGPAPAPPVPGIDPGEVATAVATMAAAPSDKARQVIEWWRVAHGKPRPPKLNPAQLRTLEDAIPDLGLERLHEAVEWSAQNGVPEFIKCVRGAYTKRQRDEQPEGDTGHGVAGQRAARGPEPRPHGRAAGEPRRVSAFAKYR
jgi:hypothetical protein